MLHFTEEDVRRSFTMGDAIACVRDSFRALGAGEAVNQPRRRLALSTGAVLHSMAGAYRGYFGTKVYSTHPGHPPHFTVLLYDAKTAALLAQFEANHLGQIRTGASSAVAADVLSNHDASVLGVIGSGFQAETQVEAIRAVRPIQKVRVWSRDPEKRERFAAKVGAEAVPEPEAAAQDADILVTATNAKDPVIRAEAVPDSTLVIAMGSNHPQRRELPADLVKAAIVVCDSVEQCRVEAGDLLLAFDEQGWTHAVDFGELVADSNQTAGLGDRLVIYKSVGLGVQDVAAAAWLYEHATPGLASAGLNPAMR